MATIKDIALLAGVSHGTVSNVLNKKENVSVEKINLVENAARTLGYQLNVQAKQLRQGSAKRVCLLVPKIGMKFYRDMFESLNEVLREKDYDVDIYYTNDLNHYEKKLLERAASSNPATIIIVSSFLENTGVFNQNTKMIFVDRKVKAIPEGALQIGFDFEMAGKEVAERCLKDGKKNIALFCNNVKYSTCKEFLKGVEELFLSKNIQYQLFSADDMIGINKAFEIVFRDPAFDAVITSDMEYIEYLYKAYQYRVGKEKPKIYSLASKEIGEDNIVVRYELNYKLLGRKLAKYIIKNEKNIKGSNGHLQIDNDGFRPSMQTVIKEQKDNTLNFLILKSPISNALRMLLPDFTKKTGIKVNLIEDEYWELYASVRDSENSSAYDLIRMDMLWLSEMADKVLMPLDINNPAVREILEQISTNMPEDYFKMNQVTYSLPFDSSVQILYYRKELFEDVLIKRGFYEKYKRQLKVPRNFEEYREVAEYFTKKVNKHSPTDYGITAVYGSAITAACDFLPRLKAKKIEILNKNGKVRIHTPEVEAVLKEYVEDCIYAKDTTNMWWRDSIQDFAHGKAAMIIVFSNYASLMMNEINSQVIGKIGFASVPGGAPLLGGGIIGISRNSKKWKQCLTFFKWLYDEQTAIMVTRLGGYINNRNLLNNIELLEMYPWIEGMEKAFRIGGRRNESHGNVKYDEYKFEEILGYAIRAAVMGIMPIDRALEEAQQKCNRLFNE